ncbi:MAG: phospholipid/cholesterol/gamma-HCH transport system permease protein [Janthinobacterium sp.]|jgi:phospholipid/cholesterol/gamma-HCH transport system permease protein
MNLPLPRSSLTARFKHGVLDWFASWWCIVRFSLLIFSLGLTPSSYNHNNRRAIARQLVLASSANLLWFTVLASLISLVLIRIVVVTALSYGLSKYALEMVVRVLVLELIPLTAALFVALRCTLPDGLEFAQLRASGAFKDLPRQGISTLQREFLPRVLAGLFSVWLLAAVSCVAALVLAYLTVYGFTPWALAGYTRIVGHIFNPTVATILLMKVLFFSLAVALIPLASSYRTNDALSSHRQLTSRHGLLDMVRLFSVILLIEVSSLMWNYY